MISPTGIWLHNDDRWHRFDEGLSRALCEFFRGYSVADIGCGYGRYTRALQEAGILANGWDGNPNTPEMTGGLCGVIDFARELHPGIAYDWALCLEVGEHIPAEYEAQFIRNLAAISRFGIVISWALPEQEGHGHVNCHTNEYIRWLFGELDYHSDAITEGRLRGAVSDCDWFKNTIMVFRKGKRA